MSDTSLTLGVIVGNRGFFPDVLAREGREEITQALERAGFRCVVLTPEQTKHGAVETYEDAKRCADLFRRHRERIDGIIVTLPNFGDESAVADSLRLSDLHVPVLVQATPDAFGRMSVEHRRDSFCGKISVCNNLTQYGIPFSLTRLHTVHPQSDEFAADLNRFAAICRVVRGVRNLRVGCIGARPAAFKTVRYSEKILESHGVSVETIDLSDVLGRIGRLDDMGEGVQANLRELREYVPTSVPPAALVKMAKLALVIREWMHSTGVSVSSIQCWTAMEQYLGVMPCTVMSMLSNGLISSACETDVCGALSMHILALASQTPSALLDWNNNYGDDPDKVVCFHCSNIPKQLLGDARMHLNDILASTIGKDSAYGTVVGRVKAGPMTFARVSTDERNGSIRGYVGTGSFTTDPLNTFGGVGVAHIPRLQQLLRFICERGFEHHVAASLSIVGDAVQEAATRYLGWDVRLHE